MILELNKISITGFRGYKETVSYDLGRRTVIKGDNGLGKSSIREAIVWALTGCDSTGNEKATTKLVNDDKPKLTEVVLDFILDEELQTIIRRKKGASNEVYWNEKKVSTNDIARDIFKSKNVFLSILNPYFFPELAPKDAKALLSDVLKPVGRDEIFLELGDYLKEILLNNEFRLPETFMSDKRSELKENEDNILYLEGVVAGSKQMEIIDKKLFDDNTLNELKKQLEILNIPDDSKSKLSQLDVEASLARASINNIALQELMPVEVKKAQKDALLNQFKSLKAKLDSTKENIVYCKDCGSGIDLSKETRDMISQQINEVKPKGMQLKEEIAELEKKNDEIKLRNKKIQMQKESEVTAKLDEISRIRQAILEESKEAIRVKDEKRNELLEKISELESINRDVISFNASIDAATKHNEKLCKEIDVANERIQNSKNKIEQLKLAIDACKKYNSIKLKKQSSQIGTYLDKVSIQFEKLTKDGELKEDFKVLYEGKEFSKLSNSEKIKAGLEISNLLMNIQKMFIPVFVDDAESINEIQELNTQMIVAKVTLDKEITVEVATNEN